MAKILGHDIVTTAELQAIFAKHRKQVIIGFVVVGVLILTDIAMHLFR